MQQRFFAILLNTLKTARVGCPLARRPAHGDPSSIERLSDRETEVRNEHGQTLEHMSSSRGPFEKVASELETISQDVLILHSR